MDEKEKTCKTCAWHNNEAFYCHTHDVSTADWSGCNGHETHDEMLKRLEDTQMLCNEHGYFQKDYKHCPYCASLLVPPILRVVTKPRGDKRC